MVRPLGAARPSHRSICCSSMGRPARSPAKCVTRHFRCWPTVSRRARRSFSTTPGGRPRPPSSKLGSRSPSAAGGFERCGASIVRPPLSARTSSRRHRIDTRYIAAGIGRKSPAASARSTSSLVAERQDRDQAWSVPVDLAGRCQPARPSPIRIAPRISAASSASPVCRPAMGGQIWSDHPHVCVLKQAPRPAPVNRPSPKGRGRRPRR